MFSVEKNHRGYDLVVLIILFLIFVLMGIFLYTYENYPLDDDWSYIWAVKNLLLTGKMRFTDWTAPTLLAQVYWGVLFSHLFGFSFETLRLSTLTLSFIGLLFFYLLLRETGHTYLLSLAATFLLLTNPVSFPLNFTFFSDIPFLSLLIIATYFFYKGYKENQDFLIFLGSLISSAGILVRQNGLLIPLSVFFYLMIKKEKKEEKIKKGILTLLIPSITFIIFTCWLYIIHGQTGESIKHLNELKENLLKPHLLLLKIFWRPFLILEFIGFSLFPLTTAYLPEIWIKEKNSSTFVTLFILSVTFFFLFFEHIGLFPSINQWGEGFKYAFVSEYGVRGPFNILILFFKLIDFASIFSMIILFYLTIKKWAVLKKRFSFASPLSLVLIIGFFQLLFLFVTRKWYNRYFITLLPFTLILLLEGNREDKLKRKILFPMISLSALFSLIVTQDFMAWNQTRWRAGEELLKEGVSAQKISAGFPWDCWHSYEYSKLHPEEVVTLRGEVPWWLEELTPAIDPVYVISSSPYLISDSSNRFYFQTEDYQVLKSYKYFSLYYLSPKKVYVLKRIDKPEEQFEGKIYLDLLKNLSLMEFKFKKEELSEEMELSARRGEKILILPRESEVTFRIRLPEKECVLQLNLTKISKQKPEEENGILFKILIDDALIENLEGLVGVPGVELRNNFLKPRALFKRPRTFFIHYLKTSEPSGKEFNLDLSHYSGKVIAFTFSVTGWPHKDKPSPSLCLHKASILVKGKD